MLTLWPRLIISSLFTMLLGVSSAQCLQKPVETIPPNTKTPVVLQSSGVTVAAEPQHTIVDFPVNNAFTAHVLKMQAHAKESHVILPHEKSREAVQVVDIRRL
jgi:hypothetical protein